jgi:DNA/RNA-binding domain of Phe-tRNA-synthetase-like protein
MRPTIAFDSHPLARPVALWVEFARALGDLERPALPPAPPPISEELRQAVRQMLRHGGYKPTGRGKPSSEYLTKAHSDGTFPSINPAVDVGNRVSLASGLPISVIDGDLLSAPLAIRLAGAGQDYVFNASGQSIDVEGLLCLCDAQGPCANAVKDAQRTKTSNQTRRCLAVVWGLLAQPELSQRAWADLRAGWEGLAAVELVDLR